MFVDTLLKRKLLYSEWTHRSIVNSSKLGINIPPAISNGCHAGPTKGIRVAFFQAVILYTVAIILEAHSASTITIYIFDIHDRTAGGRSNTAGVFVALAKNIERGSILDGSAINPIFEPGIVVFLHGIGIII